MQCYPLDLAVITDANIAWTGRNAYCNSECVSTALFLFARDLMQVVVTVCHTMHSGRHVKPFQLSGNKLQLYFAPDPEQQFICSPTLETNYEHFYKKNYDSKYSNEGAFCVLLTSIKRSCVLMTPMSAFAKLA